MDGKTKSSKKRSRSRHEPPNAPLEAVRRARKGRSFQEPPDGPLEAVRRRRKGPLKASGHRSRTSQGPPDPPQNSKIDPRKHVLENGPELVRKATFKHPPQDARRPENLMFSTISSLPRRAPVPRGVPGVPPLLGPTWSPPGITVICICIYIYIYIFIIIIV